MAIPTTTRPLDVLLVEDNQADIELTATAFRDVTMQHRLHVVTDGAAALEFLNRTGIHSDAPRPDVILLDLNLPKVDGFQVLEQMKVDPTLQKIPVVVVTGSLSQLDMARAYRLQVASFFVKPARPDSYIADIRAMELWFRTLTLRPSESEAAASG
jgi:CheY-like chemotaxis protein